MKAWTRLPLYIKIFVMLILGGIIGFVVGPSAIKVKPFGDAYIILLKMLVVPLVFFSIICGVAKLNSVKEFGQIGARILTLYLSTTTLATALGVILAVVIKPGTNAEGILGLANQVNYTDYSLSKTILSWLPENVFKSMTQMDMIPIIIFAILFGVCLIKVQGKKDTLLECLNTVNAAMLEMTNFVTSLAPYGIFFLTMQLTGTLGSKMLVVAAKFVVADYIGLLFLLIIGYPMLMKFVGKFSPLQFYKNVFPAMLLAASTTSSNATLPMSMQCAGKRCGVPEKVYGFTLPLGATINMDGFSVALGIIAVTALEIYGIKATPLIILKAVGMGLLLSIGAPGVKGTAVVMSAVLFEALGLPMGLLPLIAAIWPVVDVGHTTINVTSDIMCSCVASSTLGMLDRDVFDGENK